ncbi:hypothetical protein K2X30_13415 [bacterium]|nr:hypothetical protein [bacterium]
MKLLGKIQVAFLILFLSAPAFAAQSRSQTGQIRAADSTELPAVPGSEPEIRLEIYIFEIPNNTVLDQQIQACSDKATVRGDSLAFKYSPAFNPQFKSMDQLALYIFMAESSYKLECLMNLLPKQGVSCQQQDVFFEKARLIREGLLVATEKLREVAPIDQTAHQKVLESLNRAEQRIPNDCPQKRKGKPSRFNEAALEMPEFFGAGSAEN